MIKRLKNQTFPLTSSLITFSHRISFIAKCPSPTKLDLLQRKFHRRQRTTALTDGKEQDSLSSPHYHSTDSTDSIKLLAQSWSKLQPAALKATELSVLFSCLCNWIGRCTIIKSWLWFIDLCSHLWFQASTPRRSPNSSILLCCVIFYLFNFVLVRNCYIWEEVEVLECAHLSLVIGKAK